ncbi:MAG: hypothetical protein KatS3mg042_1782 [Rhodothermaceae bacterium]|nr:MAG: hypothetical protein KatS3mg042_0968 [Rhodothermaceae bacterium]GIV58869.1 MAG: hypothetical protein KatS3mg042_1782 [Rhodothermaceae bacterium]
MLELRMGVKQMENNPPSLDEQLTNHLKRIDTEALQKAISEKVTELVGVRYDCRILSISYEDTGHNAGAQIELKISKNSDYLRDYLRRDSPL